MIKWLITCDSRSNNFVFQIYGQRVNWNVWLKKTQKRLKVVKRIDGVKVILNMQVLVQHDKYKT